MGCDIHMAVQLREVTGHSRNDAVVQQLQRDLASDPSRWPELEAIEIRRGAWETVAIETWRGELPSNPGWRGEFFPWLCRVGDPDEERIYGDWVATSLVKLPEPWWESRDYETFARLAGVRNGHGVRPISEPRGLPADWNEYYPDFGDDSWRTELGDHSHSWLLASEILDFTWGPVDRAGQVKWGDWLTWRENGFAGAPDTWCRWTSAPCISADAAEQLLAEGKDPEPHTYVACAWSDEREWPVVGMAKAWADRFGATGVRFVFGFDS